MQPTKITKPAEGGGILVTIQTFSNYIKDGDGA